MKRYTSKDSQFERMRNLSNLNGTSNINENKNTIGELINFKRASDKIAYGVVRENHDYFVKKSTKQENPSVEDFTYLGGLENKNEYRYKSLSEADKNRNMLLMTINESFSNLKKSVSKKTTLNEGAEEELSQAEDKLKDVEVKVSQEKTEPEAAIEPPIDDVAIDVNATDGETDVDVEPEIDTPAEENPDAENDTETDGDSDGEGIDVDVDVDGEGDDKNKEIQKLVGKVTNKIRSAEMTDVQVKSYINSFLSAFEDKLPEIEVEDRKEMANKIMKTVKGGEEDLESTDIEESKTCNECGFAKYAEQRGYDANSLMESNQNEIASLMSGYLMDKNGEVEDEDLASMALISSPDIEESLKNEYGYGGVVESLREYANKLNEVEDATDKKSKVDGMFWWKKDSQKPENMNEEGIDGEQEGEETVSLETDSVPDNIGDQTINTEEEFRGYANNLLKTAHGEEFDPEKAEYFISGLVNIAKKDESEDWGSVVGILQQSLDEGLNGNDPATVTVPSEINENEETVEDDIEGGEIENSEIDTETEVEPEIKMTPGFEVMGGGVVKPESPDNKTVDINVNKDQGTVNISMNESEKKLRNYIKNRIEEKQGKRKPMMNESKKSDKLKKLDNLIDEQFEILEKLVKEEYEVNEIFGMSNAEKFKKLDPNNAEQVNKVFDNVFSQALRAGARRVYAKKMPVEKKYEVLKQGFEMDKLKFPSFGVEGERVFYTPLKTENPFASGGTGGKTSMGGV
jgi:hypothetical protein